MFHYEDNDSGSKGQLGIELVQQLEKSAAAFHVGAKIIHISTDYVFEGNGNIPLREYHPISKLKEANITDIFIVTGKEHAGAIVNLLVADMKWVSDLHTGYRMAQGVLLRLLVWQRALWGMTAVLSYWGTIFSKIVLHLLLRNIKTRSAAREYS